MPCFWVIARNVFIASSVANDKSKFACVGGEPFSFGCVDKTWVEVARWLTRSANVYREPCLVLAITRTSADGICGRLSILGGIVTIESLLPAKRTKCAGETDCYTICLGFFEQCTKIRVDALTVCIAIKSGDDISRSKVYWGEWMLLVDDNPKTSRVNC